MNNGDGDPVSFCLSQDGQKSLRKIQGGDEGQDNGKGTEVAGLFKLVSTLVMPNQQSRLLDPRKQSVG